MQKLINWKKENLKLNQNVFLVKKDLFSRNESYFHGKIIYIGTKILKIEFQDNTKKIIKFHGKTICRYSFREVIELHESLTDYLLSSKNDETEKEQKEILINWINKNLEDVPIDNLIDINAFLIYKKKKFK